MAIGEFVKVLVTRTDRLGDLVLSLPVFAALKAARPDWEIHGMVAPNSVPLVEHDPHLARVWTWQDDLTPENRARLLAELRAAGFDAVVMLQYRRQLAQLCRDAGIRLRYGPWSKWTSWFLLNRGQRQNRSAGGRHEMEFNLDLATRLLSDHGGTTGNPENSWPQIHLDSQGIALRKQFAQRHAGAGQQIVLLHPGSGGSALDWEPARFAAVANALASEAGLKVFITGALPDQDTIQKLSGLLESEVTVLFDQYGLRDFLAVLAAGALMIGPSTGPLHLAAGLGIPTLGLFPPVSTMHPERWGPRGEATRRSIDLVPDVDCPARRHCQQQKCRVYNCMNELPVTAVVNAARKILAQGRDQLPRPAEDEL